MARVWVEVLGPSVFHRRQSAPAASIWFEIWGVMDPGQKISIFQGNFQKIWIFSGNFTNKKIDFSRQIFEKF